MSSTHAKPIGESTPTPPLFSYAQAAKGRPTATAASAVHFHLSAATVISTPGREASSTIDTSPGLSDRAERSVNGICENLGRFDLPAEVANFDTKAAVSSQADSSPSSPSSLTVSACTLPKDDNKDDDFILAGSAGFDVARERVGSASTDKVAECTEGRKGKKSKKLKGADREAELDKEDLKPETLVPAPLPTVNFWQQRKEELAKFKPGSAVAQTPKTSSDAVSLGDSVPATMGKHVDSKKRGKQGASEDRDRLLATNQNGLSRDVQAGGRALKKTSDGQHRLKEDQTNKRTAVRGSRMNEKDEKPLGNQPLPPVEDAVSWPTPETALEGEKKKVQEKLERDDKEESVSNKPRPKEKWVPVPYIPTVTFSTPMPTRGGRGRGGVRPGRAELAGRPIHPPNGSGPGDKPYVANSNGSPSNTEAEKQATKESQRATSLPPSKRQPGDPSSTRKSFVAQLPEKVKFSQPKSDTTNNDHSPSDVHPSEQILGESQSHRGEGFPGFKSEQAQGVEPSRAYPTDRRSEPNLRGTDQLKDNSHQNRAEGRMDRGRGGYRSRGGHTNFLHGQAHPPPSYSNGQAPQQQNGYNIRPAAGPYSPPLVSSFNGPYPPSSWGGRGGLRSQSIPNNSVYGRFSQNGAAVSHHIPPHPTSSSMYEYTPIQSMSAGPYQPYIDQVSVLAMVTMQLEYYFSIDNLCKDVFLRKHMDSQGFVFLSFIAGFKRIQALTQDFELLRFACQESEIIELIRGEDGLDRLRRKEGWEKWVLAMEERDETTRNSGPSFWQGPQFGQRSQQLGQLIIPNQQPMPQILPFSATGAESNFRTFGNGAALITPPHGQDLYHSETSLSAAVPDFAPSLPVPNGSLEPLDAETTFHDEEVANLTLVFAPPKAQDEHRQPREPFHSSSSRTFSNGSIDGRSIAEELHHSSHPGRIFANGSHASESSPDGVAKTPFGPLSPSTSGGSNGPPVMWVKGQRQQVPVSERNSQELYTAFRARALKNRNRTSGDIHPDMKLLYEFWSHFLCRNFNSRMYAEFRQYALEDSQLGLSSGLNNLISYYDEILNSKKKVIPEILARHYVDLVQDEMHSGDRPAFERLRAAWRNGALDMKSRKKLDRLVSPRLRDELEQAPNPKPELL